MNQAKVHSDTRTALAIIGLLLLFPLYMLLFPPSVEDTIYPLVALSNGSEIKGYISFGTGSIGEQKTITFAYKAGAEIHVRTVPFSEKSSFIYTTDEPKAVEHFKLGEGPNWYTFYIPEGSVTEKYIIDVEK